jgi:hypothetical protein
VKKALTAEDIHEEVEYLKEDIVESLRNNHSIRYQVAQSISIYVARHYKLMLQQVTLKDTEYDDDED